MKIAPKAADAFLAVPQRQCRAVLLYGPNNGLVRERAKQISAAIVGKTDDPFALSEIAESTLTSDPARLADELSSVGFLSSKRVILVRDAKDGLARVMEIAAPYFHESVFLIVTAAELSPRSSLRAWFEQAPNAAALACYHDEARDIQALMRKAFDTAGIRADYDAVSYLSGQLGNDRGVTLQELDKVVTYAGAGKQLKLEDVQTLVDYNKETGYDDLANAIANRDVQTLDFTLTRLIREGEQPVAYLRALTRYFNRLYYIRTQMDKGQSAEQAIAGLRPPVFFKQAPLMARQAQAWPTAAIVKALKLLIEAELACKTSGLPMLPASSRKLFQVTQLR